MAWWMGNPRKVLFFKPLGSKVEALCDTIILMTPELEPTNIKDKVKSDHRAKTISTTIDELNTSLNTLGITNYDIPNTEIIFKEQKENQSPLLGHVEVYPSKPSPVEIVFDERFATPQKEQPYVQQLHENGIGYIGMQQALKHELAHISMWSITKQERQAATRTIDEGWANLVQTTTDTLPIEQTKQNIKELQTQKPEILDKCLNFSKVTIYEERLNTAESKTGQALLLWIHQGYGVDKMIELIQKSPEYQKRDDELEGNSFELAVLDKETHKTYSEYISLLKNIKSGKIEPNIAKQKLREIEGKQVEYALVETTNSKDIQEVKAKFLK